MISAIVCSLLTVAASLFGKRWSVIRKKGVIFLSFTTFCFMAHNAFLLYNGAAFETLKVNLGAFTLHFNLDGSGAVFSSLVSLLWGPAALYSFSYMKENYPERDDTIFQFCYSLAVFFAILLSLAMDIITIFIMYEFITLSTLILVGFKQNEESRQGLTLYILVLFGCSLIFLMPAVLFIFSKGGAALFNGQGIIEGLNLKNSVSIFLLCLLLFGTAKTAMFPFSLWLPGAMCAPTPVSGLLHAVVVVKAGAFFLLRIINDIFGMQYLSNLLKNFNFIMAIAAFTIVFSSTVALFQSNLKKRLAYSTIGQIAYIALSLSTFTKLGLFTALFQITAHALAKILLFFTVGGFYTSSHSNQIIDFTGMAQKNLIASVTFLFATLSICGMPFTAGFLVKGILFYNLIEAHSYIALSALFFSSCLSFLYLIPVCYAIFKTVPARAIENFTKVPIDFNIVFLILAILNIIFFILASVFFIYYVNEW